MKAFSQLFSELDASTSTIAKIRALTRYFVAAPPRDSAWAVYFLAGGRPRQTVPTRLLRAAALTRSGLAEWLFEECYQAVGDLAETITLVLPPPTQASDFGLAFWVEERLLALRGASAEVVLERIGQYWDELDTKGRYLLIKLVGGGFRVGVSRLLVTRALAAVANIDAKLVAQRMMGYTDIRHLPNEEAYLALIAPPGAGASEVDDRAAMRGQPYPFFLAHPLQVPLSEFPAVLGPVASWQVEWKYDGVRGQIVKRGAQAWLWSRGEELVNDRFPELVGMGDALPDGCALDGEILVWQEDRPASFALLQQRLGRKNVTPKVLRDLPVRFIAYDLLEIDSEDLRSRGLAQRREALESLVGTAAHPLLQLSPRVVGSTWDELAAVRSEARQRGVEGFMVKALDSQYGVGRTKDAGVWWKWKIDPLSIDAVLIYAQRGHGRRASLYTDFTFAVWDRPGLGGARTLVPFAKAYSGLTDAEMKEVDVIIRSTTVEKFGLVRSVRPTLVFELGFEGIARSSRHKSGVAVRFPRMLRRRLDKPIEQADTLADLEALLG